MSILEKLGLKPTKEDKQIKDLVDNSYQSLRVVGRGTIRIDPSEVRNTKEFKEALKKAKYIVNNY